MGRGKGIGQKKIKISSSHSPATASTSADVGKQFVTKPSEGKKQKARKLIHDEGRKASTTSI